MEKRPVKIITLEAANIKVNGVSLSDTAYSIPSEYTEWYVIEGSPTLTSSLTINYSGTPAQNTVVKFLYNASVTPGVNTFTVLGETIDSSLLAKNLIIICEYDGSDWDVYLDASFAEDDIISEDHLIDGCVTEDKIDDDAVTTDKILDENVTLDKIEDVTQGSIIVGGASDRPAELDASGDGKILIGDGTDLASKSVSGDAALTSAGALTVSKIGGESISLANSFTTAGDYTLTFTTTNTTSVTLPTTGTLLANVLEDTTPDCGGNLNTNGYEILFDDDHGILDDSGNETLRFKKTTSAKNYIELYNQATTYNPVIKGTGDDTNVGIKFDTKGGSSELEFSIGGTVQVNISDGAILPETTNDINLGSATYTFKDGYFAGDLDVGGAITVDGGITITGGITTPGGYDVTVPDGSNYTLCAVTTYAGVPTGNVTPIMAGMICIDTTNTDIYISTGVLNNTWVQVNA